MKKKGCRGWYVAPVLLIAVVLLGDLGPDVGQVARAQQSCWSQPIQLSVPLSHWDWFPDIAVDMQGNAHVVWQAGRCSTFFEKPCLIYWRRWNGAWQPAYDLFIDEGAGQSAIRAALAASEDGRIHLVHLRNIQSIVYRQARVDEAGSIQAWSEPRRLSGFGQAYFPDIAVGPAGILHAVWTESVGGDPSPECQRGGCSDVFYRRSLDGGKHWSPLLNLSQSPAGTMKVHVRADHLGRVHVFWEEGGDRWVSDTPLGVAYAVSYDGGKSWSVPRLFTHPDGVPRQIALGVGKDGQIVIVWRLVPGESLFYQLSSDGREWSEPQPIPGILSVEAAAVYDVYDMATDSQSVVHLVAAGRRDAGSPQAIFHLQWDGQAWSEPDQVSPYDGYPEFPRIAVGLGNQLHVVWYTKRWPGYEEEQEVLRAWYSTCTVSAPAYTPIPLPTTTPVLPPSTPTPFPSPTPYPTLPPEAARPFAPASLYTEYDEVVQVLLSLSPIIFITIVFLVVRRVRH